MNDRVKTVQRRGAFADEAIYLSVGRILHNRAIACLDTGCAFSPHITVSELAESTNLSRPSIYRRPSTIALLEYLESIDQDENIQALEVNLRNEREKHELSMKRLATEKMTLLARIVDLEEQVKHAKNRASLPSVVRGI